MALKTALIVDDSKLARITLRKKLDKLGVEVELAESAAQAIDMIQTARPDIVFMDHLMPEMDGFEATETIRGMADFADLPIVMCSGKDHDSYLDEAQAIGANFTLIKPPTNEGLEAIMKMDFSSQFAAKNDASLESVIPEPEVAAVAEVAEELVVELPEIDDDELLISDDMDDDILISDDMDDELLISDDMDDDTSAVQQGSLDALGQELDDALLLDDSLMQDAEFSGQDETTAIDDLAVDIPLLGVEENPLGVSLDDEFDISVEEAASDLQMEELEPLELTPVADLEDDAMAIPVASVVTEDTLELEQEEPASLDNVVEVPVVEVDEEIVTELPVAAVVDVAQEAAIMAKVMDVLAAEKQQMSAQITELAQVQQQLQEKTESLAAATPPQAAKANDAINEAGVQALVEQAISERLTQITETVTGQVMADVTALLDERLANMAAPSDEPAVDVSAQISEQVSASMADVTASVTALQQRVEKKDEADLSRMNEALLALEPKEGDMSGSTEEQLDALLEVQLQMQKKMGLAKVLSGVALLMSLAALAAAGLGFMG